MPRISTNTLSQAQNAFASSIPWEHSIVPLTMQMKGYCMKSTRPLRSQGKPLHRQPQSLPSTGKLNRSISFPGSPTTSKGTEAQRTIFPSSTRYTPTWSITFYLPQNYPPFTPGPNPSISSNTTATCGWIRLSFSTWLQGASLNRGSLSTARIVSRATSSTMGYAMTNS